MLVIPHAHQVKKHEYPQKEKMSPLLLFVFAPEPGRRGAKWRKLS
jgi:hypothetical protein